MPNPDSSRPADLDAVRDSYDRAADAYVELMRTTGMATVQSNPWLQAMLDVFADHVRPLGPVLDVGCGPGQITAYLAERGLDVSGVDLSPRMIEHARRLHPHCRYAVASATELDLRPDSMGGVLGWWSLFNLPREVLPSVLAHVAQALVPSGQLIIATHVGDGEVERTTGYGVPVRWTTHRWQPEALIELITATGLRITADLRLPADGQQGPGVVLVARRGA